MKFTSSKFELKMGFAAGALFLLLVPNAANAQACLDPPTNQYGQCAKQAGGRCDPARGWIGQNRAKFTICMGGSGPTSGSTKEMLIRYYDMDGKPQTLSTPQACPWQTADRCLESSKRTGKFPDVAGARRWCAKQCS